MLVFPFAVGIATTVALWGEEADPLFFSTCAEVIALGVVAMALEGRVFRVRGRGGSGLVALPILIAVGVGLAFAIGALGRADGGAASHMAMTSGALAMGAAGLVLQAVFGLVPEEDEEAVAGATRPRA